MNGTVTITLTEAKAKFSELINRIIYNKEKIYISKKGKNQSKNRPLRLKFQGKI